MFRHAARNLSCDVETEALLRVVRLHAQRARTVSPARSEPYARRSRCDRMNDFARRIACICLAFVSGAAQAQSVRWTFEGLLGDAYNCDSKTRIDHPNVD